MAAICCMKFTILHIKHVLLKHNYNNTRLIQMKRRRRRKNENENNHQNKMKSSWSIGLLLWECVYVCWLFSSLLLVQYWTQCESNVIFTWMKNKLNAKMRCTSTVETFGSCQRITSRCILPLVFGWKKPKDLI